MYQPGLREEVSMKHPVFAGFAFCALSFLAPGALAAQDTPSCLESSRVWNWTVLNDRTLIVEDSMHHKYRMSLMLGCRELDFSFGLGFKSFSGSGLACLERGDSVFVPPGSGLPRQKCIIDKVEAYTPEMQHADDAAKAAAKSH
jgi:hypothetical protein